MSVKLRLRKTGANNDISFRVVATDGRAPRDGRYIECVGWYDPRKQGKNFQIDRARIEYWIGKGAVVSERVKSLVKRDRAGAA